MRRPSYNDLWFAKQGLEIYSPSRFIMIAPVKIPPFSGVYDRWARLKRRSLRKTVFINRLIVWGSSVLLFLLCMAGFSWLSFVLGYKIIALTGGYFTFNLSAFAWYLLEEKFPQHWYEIRK